jgi:hypothetical protein
VLDPRGIFAENERLEIVERAHYGSRLPLERRFAPTGEPWLVGFDVNEDPVAHLGIHNDAADTGDLQIEKVSHSSPIALAFLFLFAHN